MEYQKIINLLAKTIDSTKLPGYTIRIWIAVFSQSSGTYNQIKSVRFKTPQLRSNLRDFNDAYIFVTGKISAKYPNQVGVAYQRKLAFKNNAPFFSFQLRINSQKVDFCDIIQFVVLF